MTPYEKAMKLIESEHEIVNVVFRYIDRLNDPTDEIDYFNTLDKFVSDLTFYCQIHIESVSIFRRM